MTFIRFKVHCNHSASEDVEMDLVEDDMAWVFECPKCGKQVSISNWTTDKEGEKAELAINGAITTGENCRDKYKRKIKQLEEQISNFQKIALHVQERCCTECEDNTMCEWGCAITDLKQALNASQTGVEESAVDEIKRYRSEYAEQGNEDVKEPIKEGQ